MDESEAGVFLLVFGSPFIAVERPVGDHVRKDTREFVFDLINKKKKYFLIISGEVHFGEITQLNFENRKDDSTDLYEIVSSGLTHVTGAHPVIPDFLLDDYNVNKVITIGSVDEISEQKLRQNRYQSE